MSSDLENTNMMSSTPAEAIISTGATTSESSSNASSADSASAINPAVDQDSEREANTDVISVPLITDLTHEPQSTISRSNVFKAGRLDSAEDIDLSIDAFRTPEGFER